MALLSDGGLTSVAVLKEHDSGVFETATGEAIKLGEGVVYPVLHALEQSSCLRSRRKPVNGRTRVYYSVTAAGKRRLASVVREWDRITGAVARVLEGAGRAATSI